MKTAIVLTTALSVMLSAGQAGAGMVGTVLDQYGNLINEEAPGGRAVEAYCTEAEDLPGPACGTAQATCLDANQLGVCIRKGFYYRLTMCSEPGSNLHEGHTYNWTVLGSLPPSLLLKTPPSPSTNPNPTSTAYVGGDTVFAPDPPSHNGKYFGQVTAPYCGSFTVRNVDTCPTTDLHHACSGDFPVVFRTMDVVDINNPLPYITTGANLPGGTLGLLYNTTIHAAGGIGDYVYSVVGGALPQNLTLSPTLGAISGTPIESGIFTFTVQAAENSGNPIFVNPDPCFQADTCSPYAASQQFTLNIAMPSTSTTTSSSTTTTLIVPPSSSTTTTLSLPCKCGLPVTAGPEPLTTDCLYILRAAVHLENCPLCVCDVDSTCTILTSDALRCLNRAVHKPVDMFCDQCES